MWGLPEPAVQWYWSILERCVKPGTIKALGCGLIDANAITELEFIQCGTSGFSKLTGLPSMKLRMFSIACW
jgi:hypothetical protein